MSLVDASHLVGISVFGSQLVVSDSRVSGTAAAPDGTYGDGITTVGDAMLPAQSTIGPGVTIVTRARAGIAVFGATATVDTVVLDCNLFDFHTETWQAVAPTLVDSGNNTCRCQGADHACKASSSSLAAPEPLPPD